MSGAWAKGCYLPYVNWRCNVDLNPLSKTLQLTCPTYTELHLHSLSLLCDNLSSFWSSLVWLIVVYAFWKRSSRNGWEKAKGKELWQCQLIAEDQMQPQPTPWNLLSDCLVKVFSLSQFFYVVWILGVFFCDIANLWQMSWDSEERYCLILPCLWYLLSYFALIVSTDCFYK